jgi:thioesterase domain-containing protein
VTSVRDDFFELGGHSLLATRMATAVRDRFNLELPLARIMSAPTIEALADYVDRAARSTRAIPRCLIPLRPGSGTLPPLFLTPPAAGSPACYAALAGALQGDRAIYGFEAPGLVHGKPIRSFADQARYYVEALRISQPRGPYYLAGWSLGGPVAFEMACQLREMGEEVAYLGLIDSGLPENGRLARTLMTLRPIWWALCFPFTARLPLNYASIRLLASWVGISLPESVSDVRRRGFRDGFLFVRGLLASGWRSLTVFHASLRGFTRFQPRPFDGIITVFQTAQSRDLAHRGGLRNHIGKWARQVEVHDTAGSHMTLILDSGTASQFAKYFEATLNEPKPSTTS